MKAHQMDNFIAFGFCCESLSVTHHFETVATEPIWLFGYLAKNTFRFYFKYEFTHSEIEKRMKQKKIQKKVCIYERKVCGTLCRRLYFYFTCLNIFACLSEYLYNCKANTYYILCVKCWYLFLGKWKAEWLHVRGNAEVLYECYTFPSFHFWPIYNI